MCSAGALVVLSRRAVRLRTRPLPWSGLTSLFRDVSHRSSTGLEMVEGQWCSCCRDGVDPWCGCPVPLRLLSGLLCVVVTNCFGVVRFHPEQFFREILSILCSLEIFKRDLFESHEVESV